MSGGYWNYTNDMLAREIFRYRVDITRGLTGEKHDSLRNEAIRENPLADPEISALVYDVFCLLHAYDWAESGDTCMDTYREDVAAFKARWFKKPREQQIRQIIEICTESLKEELIEAFITPSESRP